MGRLHLFIFFLALSVVKGDWKDDILKNENDNRAKHKSPALKMNDKLSKDAQKWADKLAKDCAGMVHMIKAEPKAPELTYKDKAVGENIWKMTLTGSITKNFQMVKHMGETMAADGAEKAWYGEIKYYPWPEFTGKNSNAGKEVTHFTQTVWKETEEAGYGLGARDGCDTIYVVGRYWPSGNVIGKFADNVKKP